ncbi:MAG: hypothetical protein K2P92_00100 [Bdellovibrionaceae bacterium]|nr:hypothetical protein [Pseudobdellovibrionaceae bacterium]
MKKIILFCLCAISLNSYAGTATHGRNSAMGFDMIMQVTGGEDVTFTDKNQKEIAFTYVGEQGDKSLYREKNGLCTMTLKYFSQDFKEGKTKNDFMLNVSGWVIQVETGEEKCTLEGEYSGQRSLTGIYQ